MLLRGAGKMPVHVRRDVPGFVGNRLAARDEARGDRARRRRVCDAETIDTVVNAGFGARTAVLGPMEQTDLVGTNLTLDIAEVLYADLDATPGPHPYLRENGRGRQARHEVRRRHAQMGARRSRRGAATAVALSRRPGESAPPRLRLASLARAAPCVLDRANSGVEDTHSQSAAACYPKFAAMLSWWRSTGAPMPSRQGAAGNVPLKNKNQNSKATDLGGSKMSNDITALRRRTFIQAGIALGASQAIGAPFIIAARGDEPVKIGMVNPLTGVLSALARAKSTAPDMPRPRSTRRAAFSAVRSSSWSKIWPTTSAPACRKPKSFHGASGRGDVFAMAAWRAVGRSRR